MALLKLKATWTAINYFFDPIKEGVPLLKEEEFPLGQDEDVTNGEDEDFTTEEDEDDTTGEEALNNKYDKEIIFLQTQKDFGQRAMHAPKTFVEEDKEIRPIIKEKNINDEEASHQLLLGEQPLHTEGGGGRDGKTE